MSSDVLEELAAASRARARADRRAADAAAAQHEAIRAALAEGVSAYRVAQVAGLTQRAVHKIRDGVTRPSGG